MEAPAAVAPFSAAVAHAFAAFVASVVGAAVPSAVFSRHQLSAALSADVLGPVFVGAAVALVLASGTSLLVAVGISDRPLNFLGSLVDPTSSPLANRSDERSWAGWR